MRGAQVGGHRLGVVEVGDGGGEMRLAREQDNLGAAGEVRLVRLGEPGDGEGVPAEGVRVAVVRFDLTADGRNPD